jgi:hypothetical protein
VLKGIDSAGTDPGQYGFRPGQENTLKSGQNNGIRKKTKTRNRTAQSAHIQMGYTMISPLNLGCREWAISPWIPKLNTKNTRVEATIMKEAGCASLKENNKTPAMMERPMMILKILRAMGSI